MSMTRESFSYWQNMWKEADAMLAIRSVPMDSPVMRQMLHRKARAEQMMGRYRAQKEMK